MLLNAGVELSVLVSETCPDNERWGPFADERVRWIKITNTAAGKPIIWHDYSAPTGSVHEGFYEEAERISHDYVMYLRDVDVCIMHDILYQGWHLVHNAAIRLAQPSLPGVRFLAFTHSLPVKHPDKMEEPFSARFSPMPNTVFVYPTHSGIKALANQYGVAEDSCAVVYNSLPLTEMMGEDAQRISDYAGLPEPLRAERERALKSYFVIFPALISPRAFIKNS